jgi:hypothetical protein
MNCNETYISSKLLLFDRLILRGFRGFVRCDHLATKIRSPNRNPASFLRFKKSDGVTVIFADVCGL